MMENAPQIVDVKLEKFDVAEPKTEVPEVEVAETLVTLGGISMENDENPGKAVRQFKQNSLSKFFKYKGMKGFFSRDNLAQEDDSEKELALSMVNLADGDVEKETKPNSFMRLFNKKPKGSKEAATKVKKEVTPDESKEAKSHRSLSVRSLFNCNTIPWMSKKPSQMNLQKPIDVPAPQEGEASTSEVVTASVAF